MAYKKFIQDISKQNLDELIEHIFEGHFGKSGKKGKMFSAKGVHSEEAIKKGKARYKGKPIPDPPIDDEIFEANFEMKYSWDRWIEKINFKGESLKSTFFPKNWNKQRILDEIGFAWDNKRIPDADFPNVQEGMSTNGIKIEFIIRDEEIKTVYPKK